MKNRYISLAILSVMLLLFTACSEDTLDDTGTGSITGTVVMEGDNEPIENVKISTNPPSSTVFSDENGDFELLEIPSGEYSVQAEKNDLITAFEPAIVTNGNTTNVIFELNPVTANNKPPYTPILISPEDNALEVPLSTTLTWSGGDPDPLDELVYKVELRNDMTSEVLSFTNLSDTTLTVSDLTFATKYFWQVTVNDGLNPDVNSAVSSFTTVRSPDNRVFFARKEGTNNVIYSANDAGEALQLTEPEVNSWRPRKNNATGKIAFLQSVGGEVQIFVMDDDGSNQTQVTSGVPVAGFNLEEVDYSWEANGDRLFYPNFDKLYAIDLDGGGLELIYQTTDGSLITEVAISEFSDLLALKTNDINGYNVNIFTINMSGVLQQTVLSGVSGAAGGIDISADSDKILYTYDVSGFENPEYRQLDTRLFVYDVSSGSASDISGEKPAGTNDLDPKFSPSDAEVIYVNTSNDGISQRNLERFVIQQGDNPNRELFLENGFMPDWQ